jgi:hypothetical protein
MGLIFSSASISVRVAGYAAQRINSMACFQSMELCPATSANPVSAVVVHVSRPDVILQNLEGWTTSFGK